MSVSLLSNIEIVKAHERDRYIATLFAPEQKRDDLITLYAFDAEVSRIRAVISDPLPGEIRLQWWREVINGERAGEASGNIVASGIVELTKRYELPVAAFDTYFDAKIFEFYNDAFPDTLSFEAWCGETVSAILQMAAIILDGDAAKTCADVSGHGGIVLAIARILMRLARTRGNGQCFLPLDLLAACGLSQEDFRSGNDKAKLKHATDALCEMGLAHFEKWQTAFSMMPASLKPAFLSIPNAHLIIVKSKGAALSPAYEAMDVSALRRMFGIVRAALA